MSGLLEKFDFQSERIIKSLTSEDQNTIINSGESVKFKKGKMMFYERGISTGVFLIKSGKAKIYKTGPDGRDQIFYIYNEGDLVGYHALLCNERYEDSCETLTECETLFISSAKFMQLMNSIPSLRRSLIKNMSHEFGVMVNTITVLAQKTLRVRLALYLLILDRQFNKHMNKNEGIGLSREDLANVIGTVRESLGKLIKEFREEGLIEVVNRTIFIKNRDALIEIVSSSYH